jgi:hypothetical protein
MGFNSAFKGLINISAADREYEKAKVVYFAGRTL